MSGGSVRLLTIVTPLCFEPSPAPRPQPPWTTRRRRGPPALPGFPRWCLLRAATPTGALPLACAAAALGGPPPPAQPAGARLGEGAAAAAPPPQLDQRVDERAHPRRGAPAAALGRGALARGCGCGCRARRRRAQRAPAERRGGGRPGGGTQRVARPQTMLAANHHLWRDPRGPEGEPREHARVPVACCSLNNLCCGTQYIPRYGGANPHAPPSNVLGGGRPR